MASFSPVRIMCLASKNQLTATGIVLKNVLGHGCRTHRHLHLTCYGRITPTVCCKKNGSLSNTFRLHRLALERFNSTAAAAVTDLTIPYIPSPPPVPISESGVSDVSDVLQTIGDSSFASLGLGGLSPVGLVQSSLEFLHIGLDMPWFLAIAVGTCVVRFFMFPLVILAQRNAARMNNNMPQMQILQLKMAEARKNGDALLAGKYGYELMTFMKEKEMNPIKNLLVPLLQAPVFISFFMGLRGMANLPVESMKTGGLYWFTNLTIPDPFFVLPVITSLTLLLTLELGVEGGVRTGNMQMMRYVFRAMPIVVFPFVINFPAGMLCYWVTSNFLSLMQVAILRLPPVRDFFKIERLVRHPTDSLPITKKGFVESLKDTMANASIAKEMRERERVDEIRFRQAGLGPIRKTYPYDPTQQHPNSKDPTAVDAKSRDRS